ncbi:MAG: lysophospholipid acyltransferase family protein [Rhodobiaceae bacterium]|nr:lysophospholipid acyltransferase family protein [Rhodobiaceae bacterium]
MQKKAGQSRLSHVLLGRTLAGYLRLVRATNRLIVDPPDYQDMVAPHWPVIAAMWHGQHFLAPFFMRPDQDVRVLISRHGDGEINAIAASRLGLGLVRGSGGKPKKMHRKGGVAALRNLLAALEENATVALTADVPKGPARIAGPGIVMLARMSGRPIVPIAPATSRSITLNSWDKASINLPFGRMALALGEPLYIPRDLDEDGIAAAQLQVKEALDRTTTRAYELVGIKGR